MQNIRIRLLGRAQVEVGGKPVKLSGATMAVLIRMVVAEGEAVTVDEIHHDVWNAPTQNISTAERRRNHLNVQKAVWRLRQALDPGHPGEHSLILRIERGQPSAYRLVLDRESCDFFEFQDLVARARHAAPTTAVELLTGALDLWRDRPFIDVGKRPFAERAIRRLNELHETAKRTLMRSYIAIGLPDKALYVGEALSADLPDDAELAASLAALRERLSGKLDGEVLRVEVAKGNAQLVIALGDLFAQDGAHLAVGFTDTFDTATDQDVVINGGSVQGQLVDRLYDGDRALLDRQLRAALRNVPAAGTETRSAKPKGKRVRFPMGTVATLRHPGRCVFAVAYSRMSNDLLAGSSLADLRYSLDRLWEAVYRYGQLKPVALALVGTGLSRIDASPEELLILIVESFVAAALERRFCSELRIVIQPSSLEKITMLDVSRFIREELPMRIG